MMNNVIAILAMVVLTFLPARVLAEKIIFATSEWPPYMILEKGRISGMHAEVVRELCKRLNLGSEIQVLPWKRALVYVKNGKADAVFSARHTQEREKFLYYPSEPVLIEKTVILARKGSAIKVATPDDLKDKLLGVVRGYSYDPEFDKLQGIEKAVCNDDEQLVRIFARKRVPLIVGADEGSMRYLCKKAGVEAEVVHVLNEVPSYVAFSKAIGEKGKTLAEKFGNALRELKKQDFVKNVQRNYF